ncbi:hypothetical protein [Acinetobacter baumannii]|uniref:hypothetical protein n=1 Tax=Acinetobacter baumannii TaxID=470 RepID=UPI000DCF8046|nr:hypothetical protein [Acinetobacter baumannii]
MDLNNLKLTSLSEIITIVTPIVILVGLATKLGMYNHPDINAIWIIGLFSPLDYMLTNLEVYVVYFFAWYYFSTMYIKDQPIKSHSIVLSIFIIVIVFLTTIQEFLQAALAFRTLIAYIGCSLIFLSNSKFWKFIGVLVVFFIVPYANGWQKISLYEYGNKRPIVVLKDDKTHWSLLDKYSDKAILFNSQKSGNEFKIIELKDIQIIKNS